MTIESGDENARKLVETLKEYEEIVERALAMPKNEFLEYVANITNFHEIDRLRGALSREIDKYKTKSPERARIAPLMSAADARHKELKRKPNMGFGDTDYLTAKKEGKPRKR
ncbi:MAG: hypothetical protein A3J76_03635 [Candidatus Moranbacteria bacterium RBG_13_45_13]|nr:MAG: hypothetical protein A3J76_03635 [Candidatus Moranbacteria bacterium RBG_13_45_13]